MEAAENSDSGDWEEALEKGILRNRRVFSGVFERIFQKYDREFDSDESGSEEIDLNSLHHEQFEETFERVPRSLKPSQHPPSSSSSRILLTVSDSDSEPDPELAALLHRKVVKVKQEINWEEEEQRYQERRKEKLSHLPEDSDSEDEHPQSTPNSLHRTRRPVGIRRRFYFAKLKGSPENRPAITRNASQPGVETTLKSTAWESRDDSEWPKLNLAPECVWMGNSPLSQAEELSRLSKESSPLPLSHRDGPHTSIKSRSGHTETAELSKHDSPPLCSLPPPQSHSEVPQDGYYSGYDHQHCTVNSQSSESSTLDYIGSPPPLIDRCISRTPTPLIHSDHFNSDLSVVAENGNSEMSAVGGEDSGAEQKQDKELPVSATSRKALCKTKSFHLKVRKLSLKRASMNQECSPTEVQTRHNRVHLEDSSHVTISATNCQSQCTTTEAFLLRREAAISCGPVSAPPVLAYENNPVVVALSQCPINDAAFVSQTCNSEISSPYDVCEHERPQNTPQCCGYQNTSSLVLHTRVPCTHLNSYPQTALYHYEYPYLSSSCAPLQHCQLSPCPVVTHTCCSCRNLQTEPNLTNMSANLPCHSSSIGGVKRHMGVEDVHCNNDASGPCAKRHCTFVQNHFYREEM